MKNITVITTVHPLKDIRIFFKQIKSLKRKYKNINYIVQHDRDEIIDGVNIISLPSPKNRFQRMVGVNFLAFRKALRLNSEVYHLHDPELLIIGYMLKKSGKKVIFDSHEDVPKQVLNKSWINPLLRRVVSMAFSSLEKIICKKFDCIISATESIQEKFNDINPNSITINNYPILNELYSENLDFKKKKNQVLFVGVISDLRCIHELVEALELIEEDVKFVLCGRFSGEKLQKEVSQKKGWKKVDYRGQVEREEVKKLIAESLAGIVVYKGIPNHVDAKPNKLFEYMSGNLPIIGSNFKLWKEAIEGNNCGVTVNPDSPQNIAECILDVYKNKEKYIEMGKNGREAVVKKYNWESEEIKLFKAYEGLLGY